MTRLPDPGEVLASQKHLRGQLLDRHGAISWRRGRELAAQLLLRLDEPHSCWQFAAEWIQVAMDVERVDGGYGSPSAPTYALGSAEARRPDMDVPSLQGLHISNDDPAVACWHHRSRSSLQKWRLTDIEALMSTAELRDVTMH